VENSTKAKPLDAPILPQAKITHGGVNLVEFIRVTETETGRHDPHHSISHLVSHRQSGSYYTDYTIIPGLHRVGALKYTYQDQRIWWVVSVLSFKCTNESFIGRKLTTPKVHMSHCTCIFLPDKPDILGLQSM
jgi:hypothetical protein